MTRDQLFISNSDVPSGLISNLTSRHRYFNRHRVFKAALNSHVSGAERERKEGESVLHSEEICKGNRGFGYTLLHSSAQVSIAGIRNENNLHGGRWFSRSEYSPWFGPFHLVVSTRGHLGARRPRSSEYSFAPRLNSPPRSPPLSPSAILCGHDPPSLLFSSLQAFIVTAVASTWPATSLAPITPQLCHVTDDSSLVTTSRCINREHRRVIALTCVRTLSPVHGDNAYHWSYTVQRYECFHTCSFFPAGEGETVYRVWPI